MSWINDYTKKKDILFRAWQHGNVTHTVARLDFPPSYSGAGRYRSLMSPKIYRLLRRLHCTLLMYRCNPIKPYIKQKFNCTYDQIVTATS